MPSKATELSAEELAATTNGFAETMLGLRPYDWQAKALLPLELATGPNGKRQNIAVVAPNGSGKDNVIIPAAAYWWLFMHPRGRVIITSRSDKQLTSQTLPNLEQHWRKFGWNPPVQSPRFTLVTPTGGSLIAYVTNDSTRVEGDHARPGEPLLMIVNEAKSFGDPMFKGIMRCSPSALMVISSPGGREGFFYECFSDPMWKTVRAGLADCPHISKEKIDLIVSRYGPNDPYTRSNLHGEFMQTEDGVFLVCTPEEYESCVLFPPAHKPGFKFGFFDFADGRAENVFVIRDGNKFTIADAWRETNEDAVVGRALYLIAKHNLKPNQVKGDAAAKSILDKMASSGVAIGRQNFGAKDESGTYKSWSAKAWLETAHKIKNREIIIPDDPVLRSQMTKRRKEYLPDGRMGVEPKHKMLEERGQESPDRADALVGAVIEMDTSLMVQPSNIFDFVLPETTTSDRRLAAAVGM